ncbi:hypothetical protein [Cecembia calidifontis]|uniref:hypothetical protein n=1 Tax=Cecembia calidifontis TaxID=1187080 RepID=UPI001029CA9E|nr:hypothetical protein [Cecembia calidifontis]
MSDSLRIGPNLRNNFDSKVIEMAIAVNLVNDLEKFLDNQLESFEKLELKTRMMAKVLKMNLELQSLMAAIDCEEEKAGQIASYMEKELRRKERNLTVAAIVTGAVVGVGAGIILMADNPQNDWAEYLGIAGGLTEVFLGLSILKLDRKILINHPKNILRDVYFSKERPEYFPPSTWYYFNSKKHSDEKVSLKEQLIKRWETYNLKEEEIAVVLSDGGAYSPEQLKARAEMLDQLESQLSLISKDLLYFTNQLQKLY